jgi:hypothetical protein
VSLVDRAIKKLQETQVGRRSSLIPYDAASTHARERAGTTNPPSGPDVRLPPTEAPLPAVGPHHTWMAILLIVMIGKVTEWVPGISGLPLAKVAFLFAVIYTARVRHKLVPVRVTSLRIAKPALAFLVLSILSVFFSIYKSNTLQMSQGSIILLVTFVMLVKITQTMRDIERMLLALVGCAIALSVGVLVNYTGGRAHINDKLDPNDIAYVLDTLLPIVVALGVAHPKRRKWLAYGLAIIIVLATLLTGSRGGVLGLGVVALSMFAYPLSFTRTGELRGFSPGGLIVKLALLTVLGFAVWANLPADTRKQLETLGDLTHDYNADPNLKTSRTVIWRTDLELSLKRPIGYGLGAAGAAYGHNGGDYHTSHNSLVQAFLELGALGVVLFVSAYFLCWNELGTIVRRGRQMSVDHETAKAALYARALRVGLAANLVAGFFLSQAYSPCLWMTVAICASLVRISATLPPATSRPAPLEGPVPARAAA